MVSLSNHALTVKRDLYFYLIFDYATTRPHDYRPFEFYLFAEKVILRRPLKNAQMQGARNPEE